MKIRQKEEGITLVALIVTIIVLIILAAVTIYAVVESNLVDVATKGTENYSTAQVKEVQEMDAVVGKLEETVSNIASIAGGTTTGGNGTGGTGSGGDDNPSGGGDTPSVELPAAGTAVPTEGWSVEVAKGLVARDGLAAHLGEEVDYNPPAGGTWRIFYYDNEDQGNGKGYFGDPLGTVYLRRDYDAEEKIKLSDYSNYEATDGGAMFYQHNPLWADKDDGVVNTEKEICCSYLTDTSQWSKFVETKYARYALGAAAIEMYDRSLRLAGGRPTGRYALSCSAGGYNYGR